MPHVRMEEEDDANTAEAEAEAAAVGPPLQLIVRRVLAMYWATKLLCVCAWRGERRGDAVGSDLHRPYRPIMCRTQLWHLLTQ